MTKVLITVLNMSITATIIAIAVMLVRVLLKKAPKIFSYGLWAVVFVRLICPYNIKSPTSLMPTNPEIIPPTIVTTSIPQIKSGIPVIDNQVNLLIENTMTQANKEVKINSKSTNPVQVILLVGSYIWLCGLIGMLLYAAMGYIQLKRRIYDATLVYHNIYETDKIMTAFVLGTFSPKIYVPVIAKGKQLEFIVKHEQVHIRRRDYLIKLLAFLILGIHWFNPIVWVCYYLMSKDMEMSCDEAVLRKENNDIRKDYSVSLVSLYTRKSVLLSPIAFGEGSIQNMKARIKNVLKFKKTPPWAITICSLLVVLFIAGFATSPVSVAQVELSDNSASDEEDNIAVPFVEMETAIVKGVTWYLVESEAQLRAIGLGQYSLDKNYLQSADIMMPETEWVPIGIEDSPFTGQYNGNGFEIIGLTMTSPTAQTIGLFGYAQNASLYNIILSNLDIETAGGQGKSVGAICARASDCDIYDNEVYALIR